MPEASLETGHGSSSGSHIPPAPPPPPASSPGLWRQKSNNTPTTAQSGASERKTDTISSTVDVGGEQVPKALLTAFNQPQKDKKPFTYFSGGRAPDLSGRPSPSAVRKSNPLNNAPSVPRVLPIVSDEEIDSTADDYQRQRTRNFSNDPYHFTPVQQYKPTSNGEDMASITHAQYNSPMPLYSKQNVEQVLAQTTGFAGRPHSAQSGQFDPSQSGAYRLLQQQGDIKPTPHSARLDEQRDEYPHYRGFVDPKIQSPSFKRLQYVTGLDSGVEDEIPQEAHAPVRARTDDVRSGAGSRQSAGTPIALGYSSSDSHYQQQQQQQQQYQQQQAYQPQWSDAGGPPVSQYDPSGEAERDHPLDPTFAARIAEAERPKVPAAVVPSWARHAEKKREKWQQYGDQIDAQHHRPEYQPPQPNWSVDTQRTQDKWQSHYGPYRFDPTSGGQSYYEKPRARSMEPYGGTVSHSRYGGASKEWLKPYIAPNVLNAKFAPPSQSSYTPLSAQQKSQSRYQQKPQEFGLYYGTGMSRPYSSYGTTSTTSRQQHDQQANRSQYEFGTSYGAPAQRPYYARRSRSPYEYGGGDYGSSRKEVNITSLVTGEAEKPAPQPPVAPSWSKNAEYKRTAWESKGTTINPDMQQRQAPDEPPPHWTRRAEETHSLWQNESDAWRQRQQMEHEVARRAASVGPPTGSSTSENRSYNRRVETTSTTSGGGGANNPSWRQRPVPHENTVTTYTSGPGAVQRWQQAPGGETKTQSSGSYLDPDGNKVNYTKEVYTSSDPGKEFSMLTEQERKVLEEPLQPGVVSRHVTTKYYKKSTYTSSTTSSTSQTPPVTTTTRYSIQDTPSRFTRGVSEF